MHVAERSRKVPVEGKVDTSIVNPRHLEPAPRHAVCAQCHLVGETRVPRNGRKHHDYRPGMPLEEFLTTFVVRRRN